MKKLRLLVVSLVLLIGAPLAYAAVQFSYSSGPWGDQGTFPVLGANNLALTTPYADKTASQGEYAGAAITINSVGGLTRDVTVFLPAIQGEVKDVYNNTNGGHNVLIAAIGPDSGAYGTAVTIGPAAYARVLSQDGVNYVAQAANLGSVTGTLGHANGGTDITSPSTSGKFLRSDGTNWTSNFVQSTDLAGLSPSLASPSITTGLHGFLNADGGPDDFGQYGEKLVLPVTEVCVGDAGAVVCSGGLRSDVTWTDATTWSTFLTYTPASRTLGAYDIEFAAYDIVDAPDAGPVDFVRCTLQVTATTANGGNVSLVSEQSHAGLTSPVTLLPSGVSAITGGVLATTTTFAFRAQVSSGQVQLQATGIASKTYSLSGAFQHARGSGH